MLTRSSGSAAIGSLASIQAVASENTPEQSNNARGEDSSAGSSRQSSSTSNESTFTDPTTSSDPPSRPIIGSSLPSFGANASVHHHHRPGTPTLDRLLSDNLHSRPSTPSASQDSSASSAHSSQTLTSTTSHAQRVETSGMPSPTTTSFSGRSVSEDRGTGSSYSRTSYADPTNQHHSGYRLSTRPSNKRASSYTASTHLASTPSTLYSPTSAVTAAPTTTTALSYAPLELPHLTSARLHPSSTSLPLSSDDFLVPTSHALSLSSSYDPPLSGQPARSTASVTIPASYYPSAAAQQYDQQAQSQTSPVFYDSPLSSDDHDRSNPSYSAASSYSAQSHPNKTSSSYDRPLPLNLLQPTSPSFKSSRTGPTSSGNPSSYTSSTCPPSFSKGHRPSFSYHEPRQASLPSTSYSNARNDNNLSTHPHNQHSHHHHHDHAHPHAHNQPSHPYHQPGVRETISRSSSAANLEKGKGRSRNTSTSSSAGGGGASAGTQVDYTDLSTDIDIDGTDLASDAGVIENVRETDRLRSAKDALGRKMINQYARVAEIGKGVHGRVWLCEDTETGDFYAIKSVNRENRQQRSLKRSQAEAAALRRQDGQTPSQSSRRDVFARPSGQHNSASYENFGNEEDDENNEEEQNRPRMFDVDVQPNPNASFDEAMQLDTSGADLGRNKSAKGKRPIVMDEKVKQEIAIMKRVHHPNVVKLREVIDDQRSKKIFMVLEYMPGGQIEWTKDEAPTMTVDESRSVFRDVVLGLEYLHYQGIIHRDIKPANLLWTQDRKTVKISDFGVSHVSEALARSSANNPQEGRVGLNDDHALRKTEGSPAFFAPELCAGVESTPIATPVVELERMFSKPEYFKRHSNQSLLSPGASSPHLSPMSPSRPEAPHRHSAASITTISPPLSAQQQHRIREKSAPIIGKGIDVWALGVTLYCLLFGKTPFHEATSEYELYNMIPKKEIAIPPTMGKDALPTGSGIGKDVVESKDEYAEGREVVNLLSRLLEKDPTKRIHLYEVKTHPWVLRNLGDSQGWLKEHDLANIGKLHVTEEEVEHATAERTSVPIPEGGLKASFKRFGDLFGHSFLRRSIRRERDRSKSVSSTSASMTTNSAWGDEGSRSGAASRQASIVKKKQPSTGHFSRTGTISGTDDGSIMTEGREMDSNAFFSHALALTRKLTNAKAAQSAHESALSVSTSPPSSKLSYQSPQSGHHPALSRSISGDSEPSPSRGHSLSRRASTTSHLLQLPANFQRRVSPRGIDVPSRPTSAIGGGDLSSGRPSTSSASSRTWSAGSTFGATSNGSDNEGRLVGGLRNAWNKLRSGSRTPAPSTPASSRTRRSQRSQQPADSVATRSVDPAGGSATARSAVTTRRASTENVTASTAVPSDARLHNSQNRAVLEGAPKSLSAVDYTVHRGFSIARGDQISDSSESLSDDFDDDDDDEEDYGEALSPFDPENVTQPSSFGTHQPLMWSDQNQGWRTTAAISEDPLGQIFPHQQTLQPSEDLLQHSSASFEESTPKPPIKAPVTVIPKDDEDEFPEKPSSPSLRPPLSRDGSIYKDYTAKVPPPSPGRLSEFGHVGHGHVADDENDTDEEEEEVMIRPRGRLRRGTNTSAGGHPLTARPNLPSPAPATPPPLLPQF